MGPALVPVPGRADRLEEGTVAGNSQPAGKGVVPPLTFDLLLILHPSSHLKAPGSSFAVKAWALGCLQDNISP